MAGDTHDSCPYLIHSSLNLYAMVCKQLENPPQAHESNFRNDMQAICHGGPNDLVICTYLSSLDAVMGSRGLCGEDDYFWPLDLRCLDTRVFMEKLGRLHISVNYAYAADHNRLVTGKDGHPLMIYERTAFDVPRDQWDHFSIRFPDRVTASINEVFTKAGLSRFEETREEMHAWSAAQIADAAEVAASRMPPTISVDDLGKSSMDQCAIYDSETTDWLFVDFD